MHVIWCAGFHETELVVHLVLADTLVPEPLVKDFIFKSPGASHDALLDVSNGGGVLHNLNHTYNKAEGSDKYHRMFNSSVFRICPAE